MQMNSQEDAFADAGLPSMSNDMGMGGMDMGGGFGGPAAPVDDYTEEERVLL